VLYGNEVSLDAKINGIEDDKFHFWMLCLTWIFIFPLNLLNAKFGSCAVRNAVNYK
jgi:hypothetical protein